MGKRNILRWNWRGTTQSSTHFSTKLTWLQTYDLCIIDTIYSEYLILHFLSQITDRISWGYDNLNAFSLFVNNCSVLNLCVALLVGGNFLSRKYIAKRQNREKIYTIKRLHGMLTWKRQLTHGEFLLK
jgi:hypothetical protein